MPKILVIEENPHRAEAIERMLLFAKHDVELVGDGLAALEYLESGRPVEAVISNIISGGIDGFRLCRMIKTSEDWLTLPVILLGEANSEAGDDKLAKRAGASAFIRRPLQRDVLLAEVDNALLTALVHDNPLTRHNPVEETSFLRDYNNWLTQMLYKSTYQLEHTTASLDLRDAHVHAINTVTTTLSESIDLEETLQRLVSSTAELMRAQAVAIYIGQPNNVFTLGHIGGFGISTPRIDSSVVVDENSPLFELLKGDFALLINRHTHILQTVFHLEEPPDSAILSPLIARGEISGFLMAMRRTPDDFYEQEDADMLYSLSGAAGLALRSAQLFYDLDNAYQNLQELDRRKSEFVAITSHELRTPIAIMLGYASLLQDTEKDEHRKTQLATIEKQANFLSGMVDALLNLHELSAEVEEPVRLRCQPIQFDMLLQNALEATLEHSIHKKDIPITIDCDPIQIKGDEIRLLLVMTNILDNAIKFSDDPSDTIKVRVAERPEGGVIATFEDQGIGISEEHYQEIFEPFFQVEPAITRHHGGLGLGLAIVKGIVELHGGSVEVISKLGEGSRFILTLPARPPEERCYEP